ncbi:hypothetical protein QCB44_10065 [Thiomicrorhabdus sp. zzn3]|uniref:hypothetical protein n=1 Tax=Thiomicrorhabdus sp. zzn3 TaxID=3039775 RepID=UPI002436541A|nr:hypothetical protein [Thiomicrorhabdus sp. zzn3]MDG6779049.1 hypothetical protein [Thiomicrorhabdus sp. zzn3]
MMDEAKVLRMIKAQKQKKQKGASMIEYALLIAGVAAIATFVFTTDTTVRDSIQTKITSAIGS